MASHLLGHRASSTRRSSSAHHLLKLLQLQADVLQNAELQRQQRRFKMGAADKLLGQPREQHLWEGHSIAPIRQLVTRNQSPDLLSNQLRNLLCNLQTRPPLRAQFCYSNRAFQEGLSCKIPSSVCGKFLTICWILSSCWQPSQRLDTCAMSRKMSPTATSN